MPVKVMHLEGERFELDPDDAAFPAALKTIPHPPARLYGVGCAGALKEGLAVVGARRATPYGRGLAKRFAGLAAAREVTIISGGARGCDAAAHEAALAAGAPTVVFLGGGCNQLYPAENVGLFQRIVRAGGAVVSEQPWDFPPKPHTFRARNRLIAGLARATLIVEMNAWVLMLRVPNPDMHIQVKNRALCRGNAKPRDGIYETPLTPKPARTAIRGAPGSINA